ASRWRGWARGAMSSGGTGASTSAAVSRPGSISSACAPARSRRPRPWCASHERALVMRASVFCATSLDGFIARPDGGLDWLTGEGGTEIEEDHGYDDFIASVDV